MRTRMKNTITLILGLLALVGSARAQVSCSYAVNPEICKDASVWLPKGMVGQVEIVTAAEYKERLADFDKHEEETTAFSVTPLP